MDQSKSPGLIQASKEKKANIVSVISLSEADVPVVEEKSYRDWVLYGEDNLYPEDLILAWQQSSTHNALVNGIAQMIAGEDIEIAPETDTQQALKFRTFANRVNRQEDTLKDIIDRTAFDLYLHGYFSWEVIWNEARSGIAELYHVPAETIRSGKVDDLTGEIMEYYFSLDWEKYAQKKFKPRMIKAFDPVDRSKPRQLMFVKQYRPSQFYYSTPDYIGSMNWILLDNRVSEFHLNNIENGFFPSALIQFFDGEPVQATKDAIENKFQRKFTGKGSSKLVFVYNDNPETAVRFDTFEPARLDRYFNEMMPEITQKILTGHRIVSPMLFGIKDNTGWGNNAEEIEHASILLNKMVIFPYQLIILRALKTILKYMDIQADISIKTLQPLQFLDDQQGEDDASAEIEMSKQDEREILPDELKEPILKHLKEVGTKQEDLEAEGWELISENGELTERGRELMEETGVESLEDFAITSEPSAPSDLDSMMFKIRYKYTGPRDDRNRDFCAAVLDLGLIFRKEDIDQMSFRGENKEFGTYSIFNYKGSYGCRHHWSRLVFYKTGAVTGRQTIPETRKIPKKELPRAFEPKDDLATRKNPKPQRR